MTWIDRGDGTGLCTVWLHHTPKQVECMAVQLTRIGELPIRQSWKEGIALWS